MMAVLADFLPLFRETAATVRARLDADANAGLTPTDPRWIDTREGTFYWDVTQPIALELTRLWDALAVEVPASVFLEYAWGFYLEAHAGIFGLERKQAVAAIGEVLFTGDPATFVAVGTIVATDAPQTGGGDPVEFVTTVSGTTGAQLAAPAALTATGETPATLTTALAGTNDDLTYTADTPGSGGNAITVEYVNPAVASAALAVTLPTATAIRVSLATDAASAITSTAAQVRDAVNAHAGASALVTAANAGGNNGTGVVRAMAATALAGGGFRTGGSLAAGTYYYTATAYNTFGETTGSIEVSATAGSGGTVLLDWADVTGATGYRVYRTTIAGGLGIRIYDGATSAMTDPGGQVSSITGPPALNSTAGVRLAVVASEAGVIGNVGARAVTSLESPVIGIDAVVNEAAMGGGADVETDEALRDRILLELGGQGPGTANDYKRWSLAQPGVGRVFVKPAGFGPGTVQVVIMEADGDAVPAAVVTALQNTLDPVPGQGDGLAPIGVAVTVQTPGVVGIDVLASVNFKAGYNLDGGAGLTGLRADIASAVREYIDGLDVGEDVIYQHVMAQFFTVQGVLSVASLTVKGGVTDIPITESPPQVAQFSTIGLS